MENFLFDLTATQPSQEGKYHGGGQYAKKVFYAMAASSYFNNWTVYALYNSKAELEKGIELIVQNTGIKLIDTQSPDLLTQLKQIKFGRFYSALPSHLVVSLSLDCKFYGTVHGLRILETPMPFHAIKYCSGLKETVMCFLKTLLNSYVEKKFYKHYKYLIEKSDLITVSEHTKYSIMSYFPAVNNVKVFYSPDVTELAELTPDAESQAFNQNNYFLIVSGNRWIKNGLRGAIALDNLFTERPEVTQKVIITGISDTSIYLKHLKNKDRFIFYKYVSETLLKKLYQNAFALMYISVNEGFGYPPLEAMKMGVPVIASPFTSITEICGDGALYTDPYSIHEIKNRILQLNQPSVYQTQKEKGYLQYQRILKRQEDDLQKLIEHVLN